MLLAHEAGEVQGNKVGLVYCVALTCKWMRSTRSPLLKL